MSEAPTTAELRRVLGHFATGVTIVTGMAPDGRPVGFACQSFASVSLEPPLVLFCASRSGRSWPLLRHTGVFCVNVLRHDQRELADRFGSPTGRRYEGLEWRRSAHGAPSLPGALMRVHGAITEVHEAGDHDVVLGRVLGLEDGKPGRPLLFYRGRFTVTERPEPTSRADARWGSGDFWG